MEWSFLYSGGLLGFGNLEEIKEAKSYKSQKQKLDE
jgi:hypothetical protein